MSHLEQEHGHERGRFASPEERGEHQDQEQGSQLLTHAGNMQSEAVQLQLSKGHELLEQAFEAEHTGEARHRPHAEGALASPIVVNQVRGKRSQGGC